MPQILINKIICWLHYQIPPTTIFCLREIILNSVDNVAAVFVWLFFLWSESYELSVIDGKYKSCRSCENAFSCLRGFVGVFFEHLF